MQTGLVVDLGKKVTARRSVFESRAFRIRIYKQNKSWRHNYFRSCTPAVFEFWFLKCTCHFCLWSFVPSVDLSVRRSLCYLADHNKMIVKCKFPPVASNSVNGLIHFLAMKTLKSGTKMWKTWKTLIQWRRYMSAATFGSCGTLFHQLPRCEHIPPRS